MTITATMHADIIGLSFIHGMEKMNKQRYLMKMTMSWTHPSTCIRSVGLMMMILTNVAMRLVLQNCPQISYNFPVCIL